MTEVKTTPHKGLIDSMFQAGAHFAFSRARRHPSAKNFIFGTKNRVEIFDLEKSSEALEKAKEYVKMLGSEGKQILFVGGKSEARAAVQKGAELIGMPFVAGRWIGGTFTNYSEIKRRIEKMESQIAKRENGELLKYTKKERLMIDREIDNLQKFFGGLVLMKEMPKAIFVIDSKREEIAVAEANKTGVPVVALASSDCDLNKVQHAIPGNDGAAASITFFVNQIVAAYQEGKKNPKVAPAPKAPAAPTASTAPVATPVKA